MNLIKRISPTDLFIFALFVLQNIIYFNNDSREFNVTSRTANQLESDQEQNFDFLEASASLKSVDGSGNFLSVVSFDN